MPHQMVAKLQSSCLEVIQILENGILKYLNMNAEVNLVVHPDVSNIILPLPVKLPLSIIQQPQLLCLQQVTIFDFSVHSSKFSKRNYIFPLHSQKLVTILARFPQISVFCLSVGTACTKGQFLLW